MQCSPETNVVCSAVQVLQAEVSRQSIVVTDLQVAIVGNGKEGIRLMLARQGDAIAQLQNGFTTIMDKIDKILQEQGVTAKERAARAAKDAEHERQAAGKQWTLRWLLALLFEKFTAPIIVAVVLYFLIGGK